MSSYCIISLISGDSRNTHALSEPNMEVGCLSKVRRSLYDSARKLLGVCIWEQLKHETQSNKELVAKVPEWQTLNQNLDFYRFCSLSISLRVSAVYSRIASESC